MAPEIVVIGASNGGLNALQTVLSGIGPDFALPIVIVQHRGKDWESPLCEYLNRASCLTVIEPEDKETISPGRVYLAPRDYHLMIQSSSFALSTDPPVTFARPSIDVLFESAADEYQEKTIGLILTGSNQDGARGMSAIKSKGGLTAVEDPASATYREMPDAALAATKVDYVLPLKAIAPWLRAQSNGTKGSDGS